MKRERRDRGAVAVWVAILLVPLLAMAALAIDVSAANADRQRLQHGADAAALAVAQHCAVRACTGTAAVAASLATANNPMGGAARIEDLDVDPARGWVEVETASDRDFWFAPIIGIDDAELTARSAASWNQYPVRGSHLPLAISWCEIAHWARLGASDVLRDATGNVVGLNIPAAATNVVLFSKGNNSDFHNCPVGTNPKGPNGTAPPGGFGWLTTSSPCTATTGAGGWFDSRPGRTPTCSDAELRAMIGQTVLVPIFDETRDSGANAQYRVFGYISFTLTGYKNNKGSAGTGTSSCHNNDDCIAGTVQRYVDLDSGFETSPTGPRLGSTSVELRIPTGG
ncbi:Tad domain-containing protein [Agrococcus carbonis]|uniref:Putative Flp pilus-assembly TadE/G-like n=1 Tax=Agrococcus carbonis TaxID=684552 RepID=A0A1H1S3K8_9MICO|nr:Tad domain-containing protein [Agrococcus carbonis]SDS42680.1 Putative Flp pilus-assembly TadE/G-like [Agrococcus carbonis]